VCIHAQAGSIGSLEVRSSLLWLLMRGEGSPGVCVGEVDAVELKCTRWGGYPCSDPIVGRTGDVCARKARFAANEFENTLERREVVGVKNGEPVSDFARKCRYEAKNPSAGSIPPTSDGNLSHSSFPPDEIAPSPLPCISQIPRSRSRSVLLQASRSSPARLRSRLPSNVNRRSENDPSSSEAHSGPHSLYQGVSSRRHLLIHNPSLVLTLELELERDRGL
jgi:hypothetical protein